MEDAALYRVVAIRGSGDRLVISDGIAIALANQLRDRLVKAGSFPEVLIEPDLPNAGDGDEEGEGKQTINL